MTVPPAASGTLAKNVSGSTPSRNGSPESPNAPLGALQWQRSTRKKLTKLFSNESSQDAHAAWGEYLAKPNRIKSLVPSQPDKRLILLWGLPVSVLNDDSLQLVEQLHRAVRGKKAKSRNLEEAATAWLDAPRALTAEGAVLTVAWAYALPSLARHLDSDLWWRMLHVLWETAADTLTLPETLDPLSSQLYGAELPKVLAYQFPEIAQSRAMADASRRMLSESLPELLDGQGSPHVRDVPHFRGLVACWTRCLLIAEATGGKCWNRAAAAQYEWLVRQTLRMARFDGSQALTHEPTFDGPACESLLATALRFGGNKVDRQLASMALPGGKTKTKPEHYDAPSMESEWGEFAILRADWSRKSPQLHVAFDGGATIIELAHGKHSILSGPHGFQVSLAGKPVSRRPDSEWKQLCWESDDDIDYIELEMALRDDVVVQRSYLLVRDDNLLIVSDCVLSGQEGPLRHRAELTLADDTMFESEEETRDGWLVSGKRLARLLPLGLPEWRVDPRAGQMFVEDGSLVLEQENAGSALMAPLVFDLARGRRRREATWRQLTIAEDRVVQPADVAVGFRTQIGREQWLLYRSLKPVGLRTVLGQHLNAELFVGRFFEDGETEQLLAVE